MNALFNALYFCCERAEQLYGVLYQCVWRIYGCHVHCTLCVVPDSGTSSSDYTSVECDADAVDVKGE